MAVLLGGMPSVLEQVDGSAVAGLSLWVVGKDDSYSTSLRIAVGFR